MEYSLPYMKRNSTRQFISLAPPEAQASSNTTLSPSDSTIVQASLPSTSSMPKSRIMLRAVFSGSSVSGAPEAKNWMPKPPVPRKVASPFVPP